MYQILLTLTALAIAAPTSAQTAQAQPAPAAQQKMVKKRICKTVEDEAVIGSRLGSKNKVCATVLVPAGPEDAEKTAKGETGPSGR